MLIKLTNFKGELPGISDRLIPENNAQLAQNARLWNGELRSFRDLGLVGALEKSGVIKSIYLFENQFWFHWTNDADVARGPIASDTSARTFFTIDDGLTKPQKTDNSIGPGATPFSAQPVASYNMGVKAPTSAPSVALGAGGGCATDEKTTKFWKYSFVSVWGEESAMSPVSSSLDVCPGQEVDLSGLELSAGAGYNITHQRIYRSTTGTTGGVFQLVGAQPVSSTFTDNVPDQSLGAAAINEDYDEPPDDMLGILVLPNGLAAGFSGIDVCLCEPNILHAWPVKYRQPCDYDVVAIKAYDQNIVIGTKGKPYLLTGVHPQSMSMRRLDINQACVSKRGMVSLGRAGVMYPSPDGLVLVGPSGAGVITQDLITKDEWDTYVPASIDGYAHEGRYYGFSNSKSFIFDPQRPRDGLISLDGISPTAGFRDLTTDLLYLQDGAANLEAWDYGAGSLTYTWRSKEFVIPLTVCMDVAQVKARSHDDTTLNFYANGRLVHTEYVVDGRPFRMPGDYRDTPIVVELIGTDSVYEVEIASSVSELSAG